MEKESKERFIPTLETVTRAAESLPPADSWRSEHYHAPIAGERLLEFRRLKIKTKNGRAYRWIYDGKIQVS